MPDEIPPHWGFRSAAAFADHFRNHCDDSIKGGRDFADEEEYGFRAYTFFKLPADGEAVLEGDCADGQIAKYHKTTQEFMMISPNRAHIVTYYFLPLAKSEWQKNWLYWWRRCKR